MRRAIVVFAVLTASALGQQSAPNIQATSSGTCSPNVVSNEGSVQITCNTAMDTATVAKIVFLLNRILASPKQPDDVNRKLDSMLEFLQTNAVESEENNQIRKQDLETRAITIERLIRALAAECVKSSPELQKQLDSIHNPFERTATETIHFSDSATASSAKKKPPEPPKP